MSQTQQQHQTVMIDFLTTVRIELGWTLQAYLEGVLLCMGAPILHQCGAGCRAASVSFVGTFEKYSLPTQ
jgi:hypothetical protein